MGFHSVTQTQSQTEPKQNPLVPVTCYLPISPIAVSQLLKKLEVLFRRRRHLTIPRRSHTMTEKQNEKFTYHDAFDISRMIRRRRGGWNQEGVMKYLMQAAERGASLTQVMSAAEKTWNNKKAETPKALLWEEHWQEPKTSQAAGNLMAPRLCVECATKHPVTEMTKHAHGYVCNQHEEEGSK